MGRALACGKICQEEVTVAWDPGAGVSGMAAELRTVGWERGTLELPPFSAWSFVTSERGGEGLLPPRTLTQRHKKEE